MTGATSGGDALADRYDAVFGRLERLENALRTEIQTQTDRAEAAEAQLRALGDLTARADELIATARAEAARLSRQADQEFDLAAQAHQEAIELRAEAERLATKAAAEHAAASQQLAKAQHAAAMQAETAQLATPSRAIAGSEAAAEADQSVLQRHTASNHATTPTPEAGGATSGEDLLFAIRRYLTDMLTLEEVTVATAGTVDHRAGGGPRLQLLRSDRRSGDDEDQRRYDEQRANR